MNNHETIVLRVAGNDYPQFMDVSVSWDAESPERSFALTCAFEDAGPDFSKTPPFAEGDECALFANGSNLVTGAIESIQPRLSKSGGRTLSVSGKGKARDICECQPVHPTGQINNKTLYAAAQELLQPFGVSIALGVTANMTPRDFRINRSQTVFRNLDRWARQEGLYITGLADGSVELTKHGSKRHAGAIIEGVNLIEGESELSDKGRYSHVEVIGQGRDKDGKPIKAKAIATDSGVKRFRNRRITSDVATTQAEAKARAEEAVRSSIGHAVKASVTVQGFRDDGGRLFTPGWTIGTVIQSLYLSQDMALKSGEFTQSKGGGSLTRMDLVDPSALGGKGVGKSRSAPSYTAGTKSGPVSGPVQAPSGLYDEAQAKGVSP